MTTSTSETDELFRRVQGLLELRSFLFDRPGDYMAGVRETLAALDGAEGIRLLAVRDEDRQMARPA